VGLGHGAGDPILDFGLRRAVRQAHCPRGN
jgi:hypothetical protein